MNIGFLNPILPSDLNLGIRVFIHVMVLLHAAVVLYWVVLFVKSIFTSPSEAFKQQIETRLNQAKAEEQALLLQRQKPKAA